MDHNKIRGLLVDISDLSELLELPDACDELALEVADIRHELLGLRGLYSELLQKIADLQRSLNK